MNLILDMIVGANIFLRYKHRKEHELVLDLVAEVNVTLS